MCDGAAFVGVGRGAWDMPTYNAQQGMQQELVAWQVRTRRLATHAAARLATAAGAATAATTPATTTPGRWALSRGPRHCQKVAFPFLLPTPLTTTSVYTFGKWSVEMVRSQRAGVFRCFQAPQWKHAHKAVVLETGQTWADHGLRPTCHMHTGKLR